MNHIGGLSDANYSFGGVRFLSDDNPNNGGIQSIDVQYVSHSQVLWKGIDEGYWAAAAGKLFEDEEFPPQQKSLVGHGVDEQNNPLPNAKEEM